MYELFLCMYNVVTRHTEAVVDEHNVHMYMFLMRDEKEKRKKQALSNKQTRQSNTAHPRQVS